MVLLAQMVGGREHQPVADRAWLLHRHELPYIWPRPIDGAVVPLPAG